MPVNNLRFPSGRTVKQLKQDAKRTKSEFESYTAALNFQAQANGLDLPWDRAVSFLERYWSQWFAVAIFQEEPQWQVDVRIAAFATQDEAHEYGYKFKGGIKWVGGDNPLELYDPDTGTVKVLNNADVRLLCLKEGSRNKLFISESDMRRVHAPITQWPELFGNAKPTFGSLAFAAEYGDDNGNHDEISSDKAEQTSSQKESMFQLAKIGLKIRAEQSGARLFQIKHPYDTNGTSCYVLTHYSREDIVNMLEALFYLAEYAPEAKEYGVYLPSYYSGGACLTGRFASSVLSEIFKNTVIYTEGFDYAALDGDPSTQKDVSDLDVDVLNIHRMMEEMTPGYKPPGRFISPLVEGRNVVLSLYRKSMSLPGDIDETAWQLVNINQNAKARKGLPLVVPDLKVNEAWIKRHDLEEVIFQRISEDLFLSRDDDFSEVYNYYCGEGAEHDYPIYRVRHPDFSFETN